jgi:hypothetical protein
MNVVACASFGARYISLVIGARDAPTPIIGHSSNLVPTASAHRLTTKTPFGS